MRRRAPVLGFTLIELLVVIAIIGVLAALLLPTLVGIRCRSKEGAAQSQIRDMESAIKAYESDYSRYPPDMTAGGDAHKNRSLVFALSRPGSRGTPYYSFRRDGQGSITGAALLPSSYIDALAPTAPESAYPCFYSPLASFGSTGADSPDEVSMYFYRENVQAPNDPAPLFNRYSFDMWTGTCVPVPTAVTPTGSGAYGGRVHPAISLINNWK